MFSMSWDYLGAACFTLIIGHTIRAWRWAIFFPRSYVDNRFNLLLALSLGYAANAVLPWRAGEALRSVYASARLGVRFPFVLATVAAERLADTAALCCAAVLLVGAGGTVDARWISVGAIFLAVTSCGIFFALAIRSSARVRGLVWRAAALFNNRIRHGALDFVWSFAELVTGPDIRRAPFALLTVAMWISYMISFWLFSRACGLHFLEVSYTFYSRPLASLAGQVRQGDGASSLASWLLYALAPVGVVLIYGGARQWFAIVRSVTRFGYGIPTSVTSNRDRFKVEEEYRGYLASLFCDDDTGQHSFNQYAIHECVVHRFFRGGSEAVTALIETSDRLVIRKFAVGSARGKLQSQADWLDCHRNGEFPVVTILDRRLGEDYFWYDMPVEPGASDLYDVIHAGSSARSITVLKEIFVRLRRLHGEFAQPDASDAVIDAYLRLKVSANARNILQFARALLPAAYTVSGEPYHLDEWSILEDSAWLAAQIQDRRTGVIYGDLTVENTIVAPERHHGCYTIDPNPDNIFDSPLIDWSKLMQSFHLGYEILNRSGAAVLTKSDIGVVLVKSDIYSILHKLLEGQIIEAYGVDGLREVYFHELINYLRLTPYKIRKDPSSGLLFFACTSLLLRRYKQLSDATKMGTPTDAGDHG